ncbi:MAG TPA: FtsX-like permease family protein [Thermoplasmata archaeon]
MDGFTLLLLLVAVSLAIVGLLAVRRRTLAKMAMRNIVRKKRYTVLVVAGLFIATAMISGSLVVGDTLDYVIKSSTFKSTGGTDVVVTVVDSAGTEAFFNESVAYDLISDLEARDFEYIDGIQPAIAEGATVIKPSTGAAAPAAGFFAVDVDHIVTPFTKDGGVNVAREDMTDGLVVINEELADKLNAVAGDQLTLILEDGVPIPVQVSLVADDSGLALLGSFEQVFMDLEYAQWSVLGVPDMIDSIHVSNLGSIEEGYKLTDQAIAELRNHLPPTYEYEFRTDKKSGVESAETTSESITQIFIVMSSFAIIAGIALIVNIFVMLAEERKPEMGISRAIGMQRVDLTQSFLFEGVVYALVASAVGAFFGLVIAALIMTLFSTFVAGAGIDFTLHFEWRSLAIAACAGFLMTLLTVLIASWRVSKLNIVRAIRDIPEPMLSKSEKRYIIWGGLAIGLGALLLLTGLSADQQAGIAAGPPLIAFGIALVAIRFASPRALFSIVGAFLIFWEIDPFDIQDDLFGTRSSGIEMFIVSGIVLVTGGVLIAIFNSDIMLEGVIRIAGKKRSLLPVLKTGVSYPLNKKFRTALSLFIFSLIMFTVVVIAMIASFQRESVDSLTVKYSGGFDIIGFSMRSIDDMNVTAGLAEVNETLGASAIEGREVATTASLEVLRNDSTETYNTLLIGFDEDMLGIGGFSLSQRLDRYSSDAEAWEAVAADNSLVIMDGSVVRSSIGVNFGYYFVDLGEQLTLVFQNGNSTEVTVIGMMDQVFVRGVFTSSSFVRENAPSYYNNLFYIATTAGPTATNEQIANALESQFASFGLTVYVIEDTIREFMGTVSSTMQLMEVFLAIGLVVGITGLGIITIRNVAERRQEIGVMRAIGFQKGMILRVFLLETSFVALLGIIMGMLLGLALSVKLHDWGGFSEDSPFVVPWGEILLLMAVAFLITLLSVAPPARAAARLAPAEALRRID